MTHLGFQPGDTRRATPAEPEADDETFEMANLPKSRTGVDGTIYISSAQGSHAPRVKWYPVRPGRDLPCLTVVLEQPPRAINHGLPARVANTGIVQVVAWVDLNRDALLAFWANGVSWTIDEVNAFVDGLRPVG